MGEIDFSDKECEKYLDAFEGTLMGVFTNSQFIPVMSPADRKKVVEFFAERMKKEPELEPFVRQLLEVYNIESHPFSALKRGVMGAFLNRAIMSGVRAAAEGSTDIKYTESNYEFIEMILNLSIFASPQNKKLIEQINEAKNKLKADKNGE